MTVESLATHAPGTVVGRLPIFPLPGTVFFPNTLLPLHVFEPRYRRMIERLPETAAYLGVTLLQGDWHSRYDGSPDFAGVMGMGEVVHCEKDAEGRYNILLRGVARVRCLEEVPSGDLYRTIRAEVLGETSEPGDEMALRRTLVTLRHFFATILSRVPGVDIEEASRLFDPKVAPGLVVDSITSALPVPPAQKQALLEELRPALRGEQLSAVLAEMVARDFPEPGDGSMTLRGDEPEA